jgi:hypothetical protein
MAVEMVNGYACANCTEAAKAARGIDPHQSPAEVASAKQAAQQAKDALVPHSIEALTQDGRPRARLDYAQTLDKLA